MEKIEFRKLIWKIKDFTRPNLDDFGPRAICNEDIMLGLNGEDIKTSLSIQRAKMYDDDLYGMTGELDEVHDEDYVYVFLSVGSVFRDSGKHCIDCKFFIRNANGVDQEIQRSDILERTTPQPSMLSGFRIRLSEILNAENGLVKENSVTFVFDFTARCVKPEVEHAVDGTFAKFLDTELLSDFKILCKDRSIPAHRIVLHLKSPVFAAMLDVPMKESASKQVQVEDIKGVVMLELLRFIYTGKSEISDGNVFDLLYAAEKYEVLAVKEKCLVFLNKKLSLDNVLELLVAADRFNDEVLLQNCLGFIKLHFNTVRSLPEWKNVAWDLIEKILASTINDSIIITSESSAEYDLN